MVDALFRMHLRNVVDHERSARRQPVLQLEKVTSLNLDLRVPAKQLHALRRSFEDIARHGANTIIGADLGARAAPHGYARLLAIYATLTEKPFLYSKLPYNPTMDLTAVGVVADAANVHAAHPVF